MSTAKIVSVSVFLMGVIFLSANGILNLTSFGPTLAQSEPKPGELYIPPTTKVLDSDSRAALQSFGKDGSLVFSHSNDLLASLAVGDVVVSEPAAAAPSGLLRKVVSTKTQGREFLVATTDAALWDAVPQGALDFTRKLDPKDIMKSESLPGQGIRVQSWSIPINTDFGSNFKVSIMGTITIDPTITLSIHTTCSHWTEITVFGVHIGWLCDSHGIEVTSSLELNEQANLTITGTASYSLPQSVQEVDIATYNFNPITFSIGPVPVVLTPQIVIYIGADGSVSASLSVNATQTLDLVSGFHYLTGAGFNDLSQTNSSFTIQNPTYQLQLDIRAYAGVKFEIFLYGLIGPYGALEAGPEFKASITGVVAASPQVGALLWELDGCINLKAGIDSIAILGIQYDKDLYEACHTFATHENQPPMVSITAPTPGSNKTNLHQNLIGVVSDPEGGPVTCSWTSSVAADQLSSTSCNDSFTFPAYGSRTLTLTGTDQAGASTSATVSIGIQNLSGPVGPKIEICCALKETGYFDVDQPLTLLDPDDLVASKNKIAWTFVCCDPVPPKTASTGIKIDQTIGTENPMKWTPGSLKEFNGLCGVIGKGTIRLTVTDPKGATQQSTVDITLVRTSCGK